LFIYSFRFPDGHAQDQGSTAVVQSYKELIRHQDRELDTLKKQNAELEVKLRALQVSSQTATHATTEVEVINSK
jgi:hypothetical protein